MSMPLLDKIFELPPSVGHISLTSEQLRDDGIEQAFQSAPDDLELKYLNAINGLEPWDRLTSETLRSMCGDPPGDFRNCLAGILKFAVSIKLIRITNETRKAERKSIHAKSLSVYQRLDTKLDADELKEKFLKRKQRRKN